MAQFYPDFGNASAISNIQDVPEWIDNKDNLKQKTAFIEGNVDVVGGAACRGDGEITRTRARADAEATPGLLYAGQWQDELTGVTPVPVLRAETGCTASDPGGCWG
ncbi:hypothetical protein MJ568_02950 [Escherichia coli]|nr:hypothetical protein MJ568_02950 [Escherichia coli]